MEPYQITLNEIKSVEEIELETTYDLTVEDNHNFYLATGSNPILVKNSGKSVWIRWWMTKFIIHNVDLDFKFAAFTPENRPVEREYAKIIEVFTGQTFEKGKHNSMTDEVMKKAVRWCQKHIFIISPDKYNFETFDNEIKMGEHNSLTSILKYVSYLKKTENIFGFIIDAWNKIEHEQPKNQTETNFISQQLDKLIGFCDYYDVAAIVIAHPKKIEMVGENYKMPSLYDIKGSSAWKEKADIGVLIHRYKMRKMTDSEAFDSNIDLKTCDEDQKWMVMPKAPTIIRTEKIKFEETGNESRVKMEMRSFGQFFIVGNDGKALPPPKEDKPKSKVNKKTKEIIHPDLYTQSGVLDDDEDENDDLPF